MAKGRRGGRREPKGIPWNERVVIDEFEHDAQVIVVFPSGPTVTAFLPGVPRPGELLTATRWGRKWRTEGRFRVREVEWQYEGRVPGRVIVHVEREAAWRTRKSAQLLSGPERLRAPSRARPRRGP